MSVSGRCSPLNCDHGLRRQAIVASLLTDVFHGRLRAGQHLVTRELAGRFGVSHTPIREALIALGGIGIVDLLPNRGAVVRRVGPHEVREVCQVRRALECEAVRRACGRIDRSELAALTDGFHRQLAVPLSQRAGFVEQARALDSRLHDLIAGSCGNAFLANELSRLKILFRAFRDVSWEHDGARNEYGRIVEEPHEHLAIVEALAAGDGRGASRAMSRHIMAGAKYWSAVLREPPVRRPAPGDGRGGSGRSPRRAEPDGPSGATGLAS
jgi:DNA-binding GntR family transcriptional regulator